MCPYLQARRDLQDVSLSETKQNQKQSEENNVEFTYHFSNKEKYELHI